MTGLAIILVRPNIYVCDTVRYISLLTWSNRIIISISASYIINVIYWKGIFGIEYHM